MEGTQTVLERTGMGRFLNTGEFSDLTIRCGPQSFAVHRIVLASQSNFFLAALTNNWKEAASSLITLDDDDLSAFTYLLSFFYTADYAPIPTEPTTAIQTHARVYAIADKYLVPHLSMLAQRKYQEALMDAADSDARLDDFIQSISLVYRLTPDSDRGLRDVVATFVRCHTNRWWNDRTRERFGEMLREGDGEVAAWLAVDLARMEVVGEGWCEKCEKRVVVGLEGGVCLECFDMVG